MAERSRGGALPIVALLLLTTVGCAGPTNPSFALSTREARDALEEMGKDRRPAERPIVVLAGLHDPGFAPDRIADALREVLRDDARIVEVSFFFEDDFDACRRHVILEVRRELPDDGGAETAEVDVVAVSMGGLIARYAARPSLDGEPRLRIARLFTIATPHRGADMADAPTIDDRIADMREGSAFITLLNEFCLDSDPEIVPYARLDDAIVGAENAAPPGVEPWWVATPPFQLAHIAASGDPRILADIARRLRGEPPFATSPPAPLPGRGTGTTTNP